MINEIKPLAVIHFAEQRAAPYSMKSPWHKRYTVNNNLNATNNILDAIVESGLDVHVVHLGTTGYYGYSSVGMTIPEGYLPVKVDVDGVEKTLEIMYPPNPGSIYHLTKCQDALFFYYYNKNDGVRITDLHQGIVWGCQTDETVIHEDLINRFDYDGDYGTVLNRFSIQAAIGHPLTVYGSGGQTRAFIHIKDTVKCIKLAIENPPKEGDRVKVLNQTSECLNVKDLALKINKLTGAEVRFYRNPRNEDSKNDLKFNNEGFKSLGWDPILLSDNLVEDVINISKVFKDRVDLNKIIPTSLWDKNKSVDQFGSDKPIGE
jgi:UDP-sulfoquinovose synthase